MPVVRGPVPARRVGKAAYLRFRQPGLEVQGLAGDRGRDVGAV